jgi:holo-[acyl-carrier protein] synthase
VERWGQPFLDRIYTAAEQDYCRGTARHLAGRFAAKEAISKVLGTGIRSIRWRELEILSDPLGKPTVYLHGRAAEAAKCLGLGPISVSITHTGDLAMAVALALANAAHEAVPAANAAVNEDIHVVGQAGLP